MSSNSKEFSKSLYSFLGVLLFVALIVVFASLSFMSAVSASFISAAKTDAQMVGLIALAMGLGILVSITHNKKKE